MGRGDGPRRLVALLNALLMAGAADDGEARALLALDPSGRLLPSWAPGRGNPCASFECVACDARGAVANVSLKPAGEGARRHALARRGGPPRAHGALPPLQQAPRRPAQGARQPHRPLPQRQQPLRANPAGDRRHGIPAR